MQSVSENLQAHIDTGHTTLCHTWQITRKDGRQFAFTDHDMPLRFEGVTFQADSGLGAKALAQTTGLAVDNTEAIGALSDVNIREDEIEQGRFDGAEVTSWLVNWADVTERWLQFRGTIGEVTRADGVFRAELRGLTEALNRPLGRVYQRPCTAVFGDRNCQVDTNDPAFSVALEVQVQEEGRLFTWENLGGFDEGWFTRGRLEVIDGAAQGLWGVIKEDRFEDGVRKITLWEPIRGAFDQGISVRLIAGCDKRLDTCRGKFANIINFQGFPDLPSEDWLLAVPRSSAPNTGGSLR